MEKSSIDNFVVGNQSNNKKNNWKPSVALIEALHPSTSKDFVLPRRDRTIFAVDRFASLTETNIVFEQGTIVLERFYELEKFYQPSNKYFECVQSEVTVHMRTTLVQWMNEVRRRDKKKFFFCVWLIS